MQPNRRCEAVCPWGKKLHEDSKTETKVKESRWKWGKTSIMDRKLAPASSLAIAAWCAVLAILRIFRESHEALLNWIRLCSEHPGKMMQYLLRRMGAARARRESNLLKARSAKIYRRRLESKKSKRKHGDVSYSPAVRRCLLCLTTCLQCTSLVAPCQPRSNVLLDRWARQRDYPQGKNFPAIQKRNKVETME